jgi:hypothetical protein
MHFLFLLLFMLKSLSLSASLNSTSLSLYFSFCSSLSFVFYLILFPPKPLYFNVFFDLHYFCLCSFWISSKWSFFR